FCPGELAMTGSPVLVLERQVNRVRQRLFFQLLLNRLIIAVTIACVLMAIWVLIRPYALGDRARPWMDWAVGCGMFVLPILAGNSQSARQSLGRAFAR